jgi:hypothetical protein
LTHLVKQRFAGVDDVSTVHVPATFFGQTFLRQLMLGTHDAQAPYQDVVALHRTFPEYLDQSPRHLGDRNIYSAGAIAYLTNLKNHMRFNLDRFMSRTLKAMYPQLTGTDRIRLVKKIKGVDTREDTDTDAEATSTSSRSDEDTESANAQGFDENAIVHAHRSALGFASPHDCMSFAWLRADGCLPYILRYYVFLNRALEKHAEALPEERRSRVTQALFDVVPLCHIKTHFITVDTSVLHGLLKELRYIPVKCTVQTFMAMKDEHWHSVFRISRLQGQRCRFTGTFETDGTTINMHFVRQCEAKEIDAGNSHAEELPVEETDLVVGCDPGGKDIMALAIPKRGSDGARDDLGMGDVRLKTFSRARYYREAGIINARKHAEHWNANIRSELTELSAVSSRGSDLNAFRAYVAVHIRHGTRLWTEYTKPRWARQRFRLYGGKKRAFSNFLNELEAIRRETSRADGIARRLVVAYGNGRAVAMRGCTPAPSTRAFAECSHRFVTVPVDEFRTSYTHSEYGCELMRVQKKQVPVSQDSAAQSYGRSIVRGLLWCRSTSSDAKSSKPGHFVNRDLNAALNIRRCLLGGRNGRPPALDRQSFVGQRLHRRVGITIQR